MEILTTILMFVPFIFILWLANLAYRKQIEGEAESAKTLKWISYGLVIALYLVIMFLGLDAPGRRSYWRRTSTRLPCRRAPPWASSGSPPLQ